MTKTNELYLEWITRAKDDLSFAKTGFRVGFYNQVCMLCQQAVEKYLKAYLVKSKGSIEKKEKIHDLPKLAKICKEFGLDLTDYYLELRTLSQFYIPVRYPDASLKHFDKNTAQEAIQMAERVIKEIAKNCGSSLVG